MLQGQLDSLVSLESQDFKVHKDLKEILDQVAFKDNKVMWGLSVLRDLVANLDLKEILGCLVHKGLRDRKDHKDNLVH